MILHISRMRRNVDRKVYNDRKNVSVTACYQYHSFTVTLIVVVDVFVHKNIQLLRLSLCV